jgi:hypothetical protein
MKKGSLSGYDAETGEESAGSPDFVVILGFEREMEQLYGSLKKLGLLAAEKLDQQGAKIKASKNKPGNDYGFQRNHRSA